MTDAVNRIFLTLLGGTVCLGGVFLLIARADSSGISQPGEVYADVRAAVVDNAALSLAIAGVSTVLLVVACLWILRKQAGHARPKTSAPLTLASERGLIRIEGKAIEAAMGYEISRTAGVEDAAVVLVESGKRPKYRSRVEVSPGCDLRSVTTQLADAETRVCQRLGLDSIEGHMRVTLGSENKPRVQ